MATGNINTSRVYSINFDEDDIMGGENDTVPGKREQLKGSDQKRKRDDLRDRTFVVRYILTQQKVWWVCHQGLVIRLTLATNEQKLSRFWHTYEAHRTKII